MAEATPGGEPLAIICGGGSFPGAVADAAVRRGRKPVLFGVKGWADAAVVERFPHHHWIALGQFGRLFRLARAEKCRDIVFIGTLLRPAISQLRLDWQTIRLMPKIFQSFRGGDDHLLSGAAAVAADAGFRIVGLHEVAPEIFVPDGVLGACRPSDRDRADIARGLGAIAALGPFDVGQAAVVARNHILAVEAAEGTDNMLLRIADLRRQGRVTSPAATGVLVKAPKPDQDRRFDLPSIGPKTVENVAKAGLAGIAVTSGSTIIAEPAKTVAAADQAKIFIVGVAEDRQ